VRRINISAYTQSPSARAAAPAQCAHLRGSSYNYVLGFAVSDLLADVFGGLRRMVYGVHDPAEQRRPYQYRGGNLGATRRPGCRNAARAHDVCYDETSDSFAITMSNGAVAIIPRTAISGLERASLKKLESVRLSSGGTTMRFGSLTVEYDLPSLLSRAFGADRGNARSRDVRKEARSAE